ncbi:NAD(P)-binding domain-containing protein [Bacillus daqingensis]|uniref:NAD(P)-binding domain-containing protein n=1 Tax=Bacillus daqingensis TaxID=872396 RepID=A0ABV9NZL4_9BACI
MSETIRWGLAGIGKIGAALLAGWDRQGLTTEIYHPDEHRRRAAASSAAGAREAAKEELPHLDYLVLALPADSIAPFIEDLEQSGLNMRRTTLVNMATTKGTASLRKQFPEHRFAGMKAAVHAETLRRGEAVLFVSPEAASDQTLKLRFEALGDVINGEEKTVETLNRTATEAAVKAAAALEEQLRQEGWQELYIRQALASLMPEVIHAYADGRLGAFGRKLADELRRD